jgi:hypothetical protein
MQRECKSTADLNIEYNAGNGKKLRSTEILKKIEMLEIKVSISLIKHLSRKPHQ